MRRITLAAALFLLLCSVSLARAEENSLISMMQTTLKESETPLRLEAGFTLLEPIDLSQGKSDIIFEYLSSVGNGKLVPIYRKDKSWAGYLNSYENYPYGVQKYSSGAQSAAYPNYVLATTLLTSVNANSMDVPAVAAVRITVIRADGSGETVLVYNNGTTSDIEKIIVPVVDVDVSTGIRLQSSTVEVPANTILVASEITGGAVYTVVSEALSQANDFVIFDIKLEADGLSIQPDGKVAISIPIPERFNPTNVAVYKIDEETKTQLTFDLTENEGVNYAAFETEHFSIYALAEIQETVTEETEEIEEGSAEENTDDDEIILLGAENAQTGTSQLPLGFISVIFAALAVGCAYGVKRAGANAEAK